MNMALKNIVDQAKAANACTPGLNEIEKFNTVEEALASNHGPLMASLYAMKVLKSRWPEAEETIRKDAFAWASYCTAFGIN